MKLRHSLALFLAAFAIAGCDSGRESPARTTVGVINAAPGFRALQFLRGQATRANQPTTLVFKSSLSTAYDVDTYNFQVSLSSLTGGAPTTWTFTKSVQADTSYIFVLTEDAGAVETVVIEYPASAASDTATRILGTNASTTAVDLYLEPAGAGIVGAAPRATIGFQELLPSLTVTPGDYEITLTEPGNPANVLFTSESVTLAAAQPTTIVVTPEGGLGTATLSTMIMRGDARTVLYDRNATAELRVINGASDRQPRDLALADQFTPPLFSAIPHATPTAYTVIPSGVEQDLNVTPAGNPGVLEIDAKLNGIADGRRYSLLFGGGTAGTLLWTVIDDDGRRLADEAKVRFFNAAPQFAVVDMLVMPPGGVVGTVAPVQAAQLATPSVSSYLSVPPGEYDIVMYQSLATTPTVLAGPVRVTLAAGGIYSVLSADGASTTTGELFFFDDVP